MANIIRFVLVSLFVFIIAMASHPVEAQSPQQTLNQYIADLQKNPSDYALREKIIKHVQTMKQKPAIPEEAERRMARGSAAVKGAKNEKDFQDAAVEFEKASLAAPWLPAVYYNLGITQDKAGKYREATQSLRLYLLAAPDASDAKAVKTLVYEIEYRQEKAAKESGPAAIAANKQKEYEDWLKKIDGRRYTYRNALERTTTVLDVKGKILIQGAIVDPDSPVLGRRGYIEYERYEIRDRVAAGPVMNVPGDPYGSVQFIYTISESGDRITEQTRRGNGMTNERILWQR